MVEDAIGEIEADALGFGEPKVDGEEVVVAGGGFVLEVGFDDGKGDLALLPLEKSGAEVTEEFAAGGFEEVEVAGVVEVVADGAFGVGDAMGVLKGRRAHGEILAGRREVSSKWWEMKGCAGRERGYVEGVNWQEIVVLAIVGTTAGLFVWNRLRPRKFSLAKDTHCGCSGPGEVGRGSSMVFRARRGERPQVIVKMK